VLLLVFFCARIRMRRTIAPAYRGRAYSVPKVLWARPRTQGVDY